MKLNLITLLQACLDFYAVVNYISDYYMKPEDSTTSALKNAAKNAKDMNKEDFMRHLVQVFLTHRKLCDQI